MIAIPSYTFHSSRKSYTVKIRKISSFVSPGMFKQFGSEYHAQIEHILTQYIELYRKKIR